MLPMTEFEDSHASPAVLIFFSAACMSAASPCRQRPARSAIRPLIATLKSSRTAWVWKQYGTRPLAASGAQTDDLGHEIVWEAPTELALDIAFYLKTGMPTADSYHAEAGRIVTESGKAIIVKGP